jgi:hypothetical protein
MAAHFPAVTPAKAGVQDNRPGLRHCQSPDLLTGEGYRAWLGATPFSYVTPAKAGVQGNQRALATLDPGFRRDDDNKGQSKTDHMQLPCFAREGEENRRLFHAITESRTARVRA